MAGYPIVGLALGSGGARGLAHAGVLAALEEAGVRPDRVTGTSMGAIVGGLFAQDPDPDQVWRRLKAYVDDPEFSSYWSPFVPRDDSDDEQGHLGRISGIFDFMQRKLIAVRTVTRPWQQDAEKLRGPLLNLFGPGSFAELQIPFAAVAMDLMSGDRVVFADGPLVDGIYASSAIPGVFPPIKRDGMVICDGGGAYRCPVEACRDLGADVVVAVDIPAFLDTHFHTGLDMILRSNTIARQRLNDYVVATADYVIRPDVTGSHWADFGSGLAIRDKGYEAARQALPGLLALLKERRGLGHRVKRSLASALRLG